MVAARSLDGSVMNTSTFRVTFHVLHPSMSAHEIEDAFRLPIRYSQSVGMQKKTKSGVLLGGVYERTSVSFSLHDEPILFRDVSLVGFVLKQLGSYNHDYLNAIYEAGGSCHFLIGIFSSENVMFEFDIEAVRLIASANVGMKFDFYGGEEGN